MKIKYIFAGLILIGLTGCANLALNSATSSIQKAHPQEVMALKKGLEIYLKNKSTEVDDQDQSALTIAAQLLNNNKNFILQIEGHTDSTGSLAANNKVSLTRANIVKDYLVNEYKINPDQLITAGLGPVKPVASNATADGRTKNRRVTVTLKIK